MADVKAPIDAFEYAKELIKKMPFEQVLLPVLQDISDQLWMAAPWRWTLGVCEPVTITANTVDFNLVSPPSDFLYIHRAYIWDGETAIELSPEPALPSDATTKGTPNKVSFIDDVTPKFRLHPVFGSVNALKTYKLIVWYKKKPPVFSKDDVFTPGALLIPDAWFSVYRDGVMWRAYEFSDDQRAGSVQVSGQQVQYSGKLASFQAGLVFMRQCEPLPTQNMKVMPDPKKDKG